LLGAYINYNGGVPLGNEIMQVTDVATNYLFANYSRAYEEEADKLAVRYLLRLKYDPYAASDSFSVMDKHSQHTENLYKQAGIDINRSIFHRLLSTHPEDKKRIRDTMEEAAKKGRKSHLVHRDRYLKAIDGMVFGPKLKDYGVAKKNIFIHPKHRFSFYIPDGYVTPQTEGLPTAFNPKNSRVLSYNVKAVPEDEDAEESLIYTYKKIHNISPIQLGDIEGYTGVLIGTDKKTRRKIKSRIIGFKGKHPLKGEKQEGKTGFYSLVFLAPEKNFQEADKEFMKIAKSIKLLTKTEAKQITPLRLHVYTTKENDTQELLATKMGFSTDRLKWFHLINDIPPTGKLFKGMRLKLIY
jgi:predicted Zn-dependent protease